jgi:hypothetical protein
MIKGQESINPESFRISFLGKEVSPEIFREISEAIINVSKNL